MIDEMIKELKADRERLVMERHYDKQNLQIEVEKLEKLAHDIDYKSYQIATIDRLLNYSEIQRISCTRIEVVEK